MGFLDAVGSFFSGVATFVSSIAESAISIAARVVPIAVRIAVPVLNVISAIVEVVQVLAVLLNIIKPHEKLEDVGEKVIQAGEMGITLESCGNDFQKYKERIDSFEIDPEKAKARPVEDKQLAAIAYVERGLLSCSAYLGINNLYPLLALQKDFFSPERIRAYAEAAMEAGFNLNKLKGYFDGTCTFSERNRIESFLHSAEKAFDPAYDTKKFADTLSNVSSNMRSYLN